MTDIDESELLEEIEEMPKPKLIKSKMVKPIDDDDEETDLPLRRRSQELQDRSRLQFGHHGTRV